MGSPLPQGHCCCPQVKQEAKDRPTAHQDLKSYLVLGCKLNPTSCASQTKMRGGGSAREKGLGILQMERQVPQNCNCVTVPSRDLLQSTGLPSGPVPPTLSLPRSHTRLKGQPVLSETWDTEPHSFPENTEDCVAPPGGYFLSLQLHFPVLAQPTCNRVLC